MQLAQVLAILVGVVLPLIVGLVTRLHTHPGVKRALLGVLAIVGTSTTDLIRDLSDPTYHVSWSAWVSTLALTIITAQAAHSGVWRPTGVTDIVQAVGDPTATTARHRAAEASLDASTSSAKPTSATSPTPAQSAGSAGAPTAVDTSTAAT